LLTLDDVRPGYQPFMAPAMPGEPVAPPRASDGAVRFFEVTLYVCVASSFFSFIQPAPYEGIALILAFACVLARIPFDPKIMPMIILLTIAEIGGLLSLMPVIGDADAEKFMFISIYLAITGVIFAIVMSSNVQRHYAIVSHAYILAGVLAAIFGIIGYFKLAPGSDIFMMNQRAVSTFRDPNITGSFYVPPLLFVAAIFFTGGVRPFHLISFPITAVGILLAFSRAAWGQFVITTIVLWILLFVTRPNGRARRRMITVMLVMLAILAVLGVVLFSIEDVRTMILQRATLLQAYDTGTEGSRFNIQQRSIEQILEHPNGMGPWLFAKAFGLVSHNSYLGMFLNHGWIGGIAYLVLTATTLTIGFRAVFAKTPWQIPMTAVFASYVGICFESAIVDTDHWRNYYLLVAMVWGMSAATANYLKDDEAQAARA
jgi:O-antigen ligase/polysaccharide polymerase Wzy-like membrane protein